MRPDLPCRTTVYHPAFPSDVRTAAEMYGLISPRLELAFRAEIDRLLARIRSSPESGHPLRVARRIYPRLRRRNLRRFPFFILYGFDFARVIIGSLVPSRSSSRRWLERDF